MEFMFWYIVFSIKAFIVANAIPLAAMGTLAGFAGCLLWLNKRAIKRRQAALGDVWTTEDGREVLLSAMSNHHLHNAINYLIHRREKLSANILFADDWIEKLKAEKARRY
jgi:hypothetical protein